MHKKVAVMQGILNAIYGHGMFGKDIRISNFGSYLWNSLEGCGSSLSSLLRFCPFLF